MQKWDWVLLGKKKKLMLLCGYPGSDIFIRKMKRVPQTIM